MISLLRTKKGSESTDSKSRERASGPAEMKGRERGGREEGGRREEGRREGGEREEGEGGEKGKWEWRGGCEGQEETGERGR